MEDSVAVAWEAGEDLEVVEAIQVEEHRTTTIFHLQEEVAPSIQVKIKNNLSGINEDEGIVFVTFNGTIAPYCNLGCTYPQACNYNPESNFDDGSCDYCFCLEGTQWSDSLQGCVSTAPPLMDACGAGTYWDEESQACLTTVTCAEDLNTDGIVGIADLLQLLSMFGTPCDEVETSEFSCGDPMNYHGYDYATVQIGEQCWFAENLRTEHYANGDSIPANLSDEEWVATTSGAVSVYGEGMSSCTNEGQDIDACDAAQSLNEYGRLYNWYAVADARGLCPVGWHVPAAGQFADLENYVTSQGFSEMEGTALKSTYGWTSGANGTDDFGFSGLPGGCRDYYDGDFSKAGIRGYWWSSSPSNGAGWYRYLREYDLFTEDSVSVPWIGFSVRCIKDSE